MIKRGNLQTKAVKFLILDKSNEGEMLSKGFKDEIYEAYRYDVQGIEQYYVDVVKKSGSLIHFVIFMGRLLSIKLLTSTAQDKRWISLLRRWGVVTL